MVAVDTQQWAKPVVGEWAVMKIALEKLRQGVLEDKVMPGKEYIEKKLAEIEGGQYDFGAHASEGPILPFPEGVAIPDHGFLGVCWPVLGPAAPLARPSLVGVYWSQFFKLMFWMMGQSRSVLFLVAWDACVWPSNYVNNCMTTFVNVLQTSPNNAGYCQLPVMQTDNH